MVFVFFQNNKCIADVAILLVFVVIARSLQFQMPYKREEKKKDDPCSLSQIGGRIGSSNAT